MIAGLLSRCSRRLRDHAVLDRKPASTTSPHALIRASVVSDAGGDALLLLLLLLLPPLARAVLLLAMLNVFARREL